MLSIKAIAIALTAAIMCAAQGIEIKGTVKDASGAALAGVLVRLDKTKYTATSAADGSFTLNDKSTGITVWETTNPTAKLSASVGRGSLWIQVPEAAEVTVTSFGMGGKVLSSLKLRMGAGVHPIALPHGGQGLVFYRIQSNGHEVMTRSLNLSTTGATGATGTVFAIPGHSKSPLAKSAASAGFKDILSASKTGYLPYRLTVTNQAATGLEVQMLASAGVLKDADGNEYQTVKIGNQTWMAEHMRTTKYADGTAIPHIQDKAGWANRATPAYCNYNGMADADSLKRFGRLYNWHVIKTNKLPPEGWRVPGDADWTALQNHLIANGFNFDGTKSGNKIGKSMSGMTDWVSATKVGAIGNDMTKNNKSGFGGVPTGFRDQGGNFTLMGTRCIMHATSTKENLFGYFADLDAASETLRYSDDWMSMGFLVRLIKI